MGRSYVTGRGVYNAYCDVCGFQYKNFQLRKRWDGLIVCKEDWETRHPQEFVRARNDYHPLPWVRAVDPFVEPEAAASVEEEAAINGYVFNEALLG